MLPSSGLLGKIRNALHERARARSCKFCGLADLGLAGFEPSHDHLATSGILADRLRTDSKHDTRDRQRRSGHDAGAVSFRLRIYAVYLGGCELPRLILQQRACADALFPAAWPLRHGAQNQGDRSRTLCSVPFERCEVLWLAVLCAVFSELGPFAALRH